MNSDTSREEGICGARDISHPSAFSVVVACICLSSPAIAATEFGMNLEMGVIRSDNIFLAADDAKQSETVFTLAPEFYLASDDRRWSADIHYQPQAVFYDEFDDGDEVFQRLDASVTTVLLSDRFFLNLNAINFQTVTDPDARIPGGNLSLTSNRTDSRVLQASPYWQQRVGPADLLIRGTYTDFEYDDDRFQSSNTREGYFRLGNIERQQGLAWQLDYTYRRTEYEISTPWEFQRAALNLGTWVNARTRLFVVGGAETAFDNLYEANMDADFWEVGFQYAPNQRLNLEMAAGDRSYGNSFRGELTYELKRGRLSASYDEVPTNRSDLLMGRRPLEPFGDLDGALDRPGASDRFVRKHGQFSVNVDLARSDLTLRVFSDVREERTTADGIVLDDEKLVGFGAKWSWQFGRKTTLGLSGDVSDRDYSGFDDEFRRARIDVEYQLSARLSLSVEFARFEQDGDQTAARDYTENQYRFFLNASY